MNKISTVFLLLLLSLAVQLLGQTNVSGGIYNDVTWSLAGSPYIVTGDIVVFPNRTLTIEPGVEVRVQGNAYPNPGTYIEIRGTLVAVGTPNASITFKGDGAVTDPWSWSGIYVKTVQGGDAIFDYVNISNANQGFTTDLYVVKPGVIELQNCNFSNNGTATSPWFTAKFSNCTFSNNQIGIQPIGNYDVGLILQNCDFVNNGAAFTYVYDTVTIDGCSFINNVNPIISFMLGTITNSLFDGNETAFNGYGGIVDNCEFINNTSAILGLSAGAVTNCVIRNNQLGVEITTGAILMNNVISNNVVGVRIWDNVPGFADNQICGNSLYNVENAMDKNISLVGNCFCESDSTVAEQLLFDGYDDITKGLFNYAIYDSTCTNIVQLVSKVIVGQPGGEAQTVQLYPNPARDWLHVRLPGGTHNASMVRIMNLQGQELMRKDLVQDAVLDVSGLARGLYLIEVAGDGRTVRTWVKE